MSKTKILVMTGIDIVLDNFITDESKSKSMFEDNGSFQRCLIRYLKNNIDNYSYLVIIGNFTQDGVELQYKRVLSIIGGIVQDLKLNKQNIMLVPGRGDIDFAHLKSLIAENSGSNPSMDDKLHKFTQFYADFFESNKAFEPSNVIWDQIKIPNIGISLLSINTLTSYSYQKQRGKGHIDDSALNSFFDSSKEDEKVFKILFGYNGFVGEAEEGFIDNTSEIQSTLSFNKVHVMFNRVNEIDASKKENSESNYFIGINDIGGSSPSFLILEGDEQGLTLKYYIYREQKHGESYWDEDTSNPNVIRYIPINPPTGINALSQDSINDNSNDIAFQEKESEQKVESTNAGDYFGYKYEEGSDSIPEYLIKVIRKNKLFMSGHFHWSKNGRSLSFIKTEYLFENYDCLERVKILYKKIINDYKLLQDPKTVENYDNHKCLLIGYAMPGVMVGTQLAIYYKTPFSYIPAFIKHHTDDENGIPNGEYDTVIVIIDIIYKSHLIDWIIDKLFEKETIKRSLKKINIITLFWGNRDEYKCSELKINQEKTRDEDFLDVKLYFINRFPLDMCNYKDKEECPVYCKRLAPVHVLSSEDKK